MLALSLPLAQVVRADNDTDNKKKKHKHQTEAAAEQQSAQATKKVTGQPVKYPVQQVQPKMAPIQPTLKQKPNYGAPVNRQPVKNEANLNGQGQAQNRNPNRHVDRNSYTVARSRVVYGHHNRNWWVARYPHTRFVPFGGGYYFWNLGYWYPAFGYSPFYNNYAYSEPIYGYNNFAPGQVIENVQLALRNQRYYPGAIDGLIGPQTRAALAAFQRDRGLIVTSAVDEPTLVALGLA
jgi:hypothetical protein